MTERFSPGKNALLLSGSLLFVLFLLTLFVPYLGLLPMMAVFVGMMLTSYFTSHYLNEITESHQRATVLSFKGLAFNAAYGFIGLVFAGLIQQFRKGAAGLHPDWPALLLRMRPSRRAGSWFPWYLALGLVLVSLFVCPDYSAVTRRGEGRRLNRAFQLSGWRVFLDPLIWFQARQVSSGSGRAGRIW